MTLDIKVHWGRRIDFPKHYSFLFFSSFSSFFPIFFFYLAHSCCFFFLFVFVNIFSLVPSLWKPKSLQFCINISLGHMLLKFLQKSNSRQKTLLCWHWERVHMAFSISNVYMLMIHRVHKMHFSNACNIDAKKKRSQAMDLFLRNQILLCINLRYPLFRTQTQTNEDKTDFIDTLDIISIANTPQTLHLLKSTWGMTKAKKRICDHSARD